MKKFKVGDKVRVLIDNPCGAQLLKDEITTITYIESNIDDDGYTITVEPGDVLNDHSKLYTCHWLVEPRHLELVYVPLSEDLFTL